MSFAVSFEILLIICFLLFRSYQLSWGIEKQISNLYVKR